MDLHLLLCSTLIYCTHYGLEKLKFIKPNPYSRLVLVEDTGPLPFIPK